MRPFQSIRSPLGRGTKEHEQRNFISALSFYLSLNYLIHRFPDEAIEFRWPLADGTRTSLASLDSRFRSFISVDGN